MPETVAEKVARTRKEQGLPPRIENVSFYDRIATAVVELERQEKLKEAA